MGHYTNYRAAGNPFDWYMNEEFKAKLRLKGSSRMFNECLQNCNGLPRKGASAPACGWGGAWNGKVHPTNTQEINVPRDLLLPHTEHEEPR